MKSVKHEDVEQINVNIAAVRIRTMSKNVSKTKP